MQRKVNCDRRLAVYLSDLKEREIKTERERERERAIERDKERKGE